ADGTLWRWNGSASASGTNLGNVGTSYYADPRLISSAPANQPHATFSISGSTLTVTRDPAWNSAMVITVTVSDGHGGTDTETFTVNVVQPRSHGMSAVWSRLPACGRSRLKSRPPPPTSAARCRAGGPGQRPGVGAADWSDGDCGAWWRLVALYGTL